MFAPVVQWIEHWSPEPKIWVRLPAGAPHYFVTLVFLDIINTYEFRLTQPSQIRA